MACEVARGQPLRSTCSSLKLKAFPIHNSHLKIKMFKTHVDWWISSGMFRVFTWFYPLYTGNSMELSQSMRNLTSGRWMWPLQAAWKACRKCPTFCVTHGAGDTTMAMAPRIHDAMAMEKTLADVCFIVYLLIMIISCISWSWKISWRRIWYSRIFIEIWISPSCSLVGRRFFNYIYITLYKNG